MLNPDSHCSLCKDKDKIIDELKALLKEKEFKIKYLESRVTKSRSPERDLLISRETSLDNSEIKLSNEEIMRYSRQLILPEIGINGQKCLKKTSVLIVGAGGLGCPAGLYLAASGIGKIGIVDYDNVELSNIHRQVLHYEEDIGTSKCRSFARSIRQVNSATTCVCHNLSLNSRNAENVLKCYDIVLDATDNVPTRYLLSDASVLLQKPLISGSALRYEGQLTVYNYKNGPCYRCLYPIPPTPNAVSNCSESGVIGPVTGVIGCLQALEAIKIAVGLESSFVNKMLYFDGECGQFRTFKLRGKNKNCSTCAGNKIVKLIDYEIFCQTQAEDKFGSISVLSEEKRISCTNYKKICDEKMKHILVDVRPANEIEICSLPNSINIPLNKLNDEVNIQTLRTAIQQSDCLFKSFVICRRGNDSQRAVLLLQDKFKDLNISWYDIKGGLTAWHKEIDPTFPLY